MIYNNGIIPLYQTERAPIEIPMFILKRSKINFKNKEVQ